MDSEFQFHSGSIKSVARALFDFQRTRFNSIVVRLKAGMSGLIRSSMRSFQFHSGSIKSSSILFGLFFAMSVSIP